MMNKIWDKIGICASGLCLIHCLATPILLLVFPSIHIAGDQHGHVHEIFGVIVIISILLAVYPHCRRHGHKDIIAFALVGVICILTGILAHDLPTYIGQGITVVGSISLIIAHIRNMKVRHGKCESNESSCSNH